MERVAAQKAAGERIVNMRLDRSCAIECLAKTRNPAVRVDANPEHVREFLGS
jgi:hypothetical protein